MLLKESPHSDEDEAVDLPGNPQLKDPQSIPQGSDKTTEALDTALKDLTPR